MTSERVIRVDRQDAANNDPTYVLIYVTSKRSGFDLDLIGTDGYSPYIGSSSRHSIFISQSYNPANIVSQSDKIRLPN
jgi:hypothetical protein